MVMEKIDIETADEAAVLRAEILALCGPASTP